MAEILLNLPRQIQSLDPGQVSLRIKRFETDENDESFLIIEIGEYIEEKLTDNYVLLQPFEFEFLVHCFKADDEGCLILNARRFHVIKDSNKRGDDVFILSLESPVEETSIVLDKREAEILSQKFINRIETIFKQSK